MVLLALPLLHCLLMHFLIGLQFNLSYKASSRKRKRRIEGLFLFFLLSQLQHLRLNTQQDTSKTGKIMLCDVFACIATEWGYLCHCDFFHISSRIHFKCFKGKTYIYVIYFYIVHLIAVITCFCYILMILLECKKISCFHLNKMAKI